MSEPFYKFNAHKEACQSVAFVSATLQKAEQFAGEVTDQSIRVAQDHPYATTAALCLVGLCVKSPVVKEAAKETIDGISGRLAVGVDDALMASRKTVKFPIAIVGKSDALHLDEPVESTLSQAYMKARQSVARVITTKAVDGGAEARFNATAFAVSKEGKFVTNYHVVMDRTENAASEIKLVDRFKKEHPADVLSLDKGRDLAIIQLRHPSANVLFKPLKFGKELKPGYNLNPEEEVFCFGHPHGTETLIGSVKSDVRIRWSDTPYHKRWGETVVPIHTEGGGSGSPLLNSHGEVIGVISSGPPPSSPLYKSLSVSASSDQAEALLNTSIKDVDHRPWWHYLAK
jgi:S1-C subfamily serine protease